MFHRIRLHEAGSGCRRCFRIGLRWAGVGVCGQRRVIDFRLIFAIEFCQFSDLTTVKLRRRETQFFFESLL